jgi:glycosyltransferase involved in cell wall biosynthesis
MLMAADAFRPDIVHAFKPIGYSGVLAVLLQHRGYRVVVDVDDLETEAGWGQHRRWGLRQLVGWQERSVLRRTADVSAASRYLDDWVAGIRSGPCLYLPNGLDRASEPAPVAFNPAIVLLYTRGNDVSAARVARLWSAILQKTPQASLRIVGDWSEAPKDLPRCERLGWLEGEALAAAIRGSALALFPIEDNPLVRAKSPGRLLDCLAHGLPIVTEDVGEYGLLAGPGAALSAGDDDALAAATVEFLENRSARAARAEISWRQAGRHTWTRRVAALAGWYEQVGSRLPDQ